MRLRQRSALVVVGIMLGSAGPLRADDQPPTAPAADATNAASPVPADSRSPAERLHDAVDDATTPLPRRPQLAFKPSYTFPKGADGYTAELQFEPVIPYHGLFIPDFEVPGFWSIARIQISGQSLQNDSGPASGITDLTLTDLAARQFGPLNVGLGFATVFPMATAPALGQGKWQLGPAIGARLDAIPHLELAALVQNFYSVAGSNQSPNLAYVTVQPFVTVDLPADMFLASNAPMNFYWLGGKSTVPVDIGLGRAFSDRFVGDLEFWYTLAESGEGEIKVRAVLTFRL
jgi:hypothetical protein